MKKQIICLSLFLVSIVSTVGPLTAADFIKFFQQKADEGAKAVQQVGESISKGVEDVKKEAEKVTTKIGEASENLARETLHKVVIPTTKKIDQAEAEAKKVLTPEDPPYHVWVNSRR